ncbi:S24 family peptidase [Ornithinimicrobium sp. Arc0846-15]|nr:S24 family peptidase [Ornithinimicrobium laminariae]
MPDSTPPRRQRGKLPVGVAVVHGASMLPTYAEGDRLLVRYGATVGPGDVVIAQLPDGPSGKRPLGVKRLTRWEWGKAWLASDNPGQGTDSSVFGALPPEKIIGKVVRRLPRKQSGA